MDALTVFSHGTIPQRAEKLQRHRFRLQAFHAAIGNHLAGRREILGYPLDNNSTTHERLLVAGQQSLHAVPSHHTPISKTPTQTKHLIKSVKLPKFRDTK
jgi:hypothetical protein